MPAVPSPDGSPLGSHPRHRNVVYTVYMIAESTAGSIATAARLLLDEGGVDAVTMRRVASAVGLTAMAIYRHYPDRKGLLNALADEGFRELSEQLRATTLSGDIEA